MSIIRQYSRIRQLRPAGTWTRTDPIDPFNQMIPEFNHKETGKFLDGRMSEGLLRTIRTRLLDH